MGAKMRLGLPNLVEQETPRLGSGFMQVMSHAARLFPCPFDKALQELAQLVFEPGTVTVLGKKVNHGGLRRSVRHPGRGCRALGSGGA